jgi:hypothetical protein
MESLDAQIREQMTVYAPPELKAIYTRFLKMYARIQQEQEEIWFIEVTTGVVAVVFISLLFGWLMWQLRVLSGGF